MVIVKLKKNKFVVAIFVFFEVAVLIVGYWFVCGCEPQLQLIAKNEIKILYLMGMAPSWSPKKE